MKQSEPPNLRYAECCFNCDHSRPTEYGDRVCHKFQELVSNMRVCDDYEQEVNNEDTAKSKNR